MNREAFLSRVGQATIGSVLPAPPEVSSDLPEPDAVDHLARFRARAQAVNAVVHGPVSRHGVPRAVVGIAGGHDASSFMAWDELPASGVAAALAAYGLERVDHEVHDDGRLAHYETYRSLDIGVTGTVAGLAESGSVVLTHGPGKPRMASIVPDIHIALLETKAIHRSLAYWAREFPALAAETTNLVVVTGPSRTGDIEQQLNLGVHGPRHVHIVLIR